MSDLVYTKNSSTWKHAGTSSTKFENYIRNLSGTNCLNATANYELFASYCASQVDGITKNDSQNKRLISNMILYLKIVVQSCIETPLARPSFETNGAYFKQFYNLEIEIMNPLDAIN